MKISSNTFVSLTYDLTVDGELVDQATTERPLEFIYGAGFLLPSFEENIKDLEAGDEFDFKLDAENAYGVVIDEAVVELPKSTFVVDGKIEEGMLENGNRIPMMNNQGNQMVGVVQEVKDDVVVMDFNHPLAGKELNFKGKIVSVREATDVDRAKFMGLGGGCDCGCEDNDCSCDDNSSCGSDCGCSDEKCS
ncbi:MAG: peptidylprolyl isomerase [Rikenellaceae bacterium]|nr:peptidylprolyl isomerase [Rikenellaceae bacterium]